MHLKILFYDLETFLEYFLVVFYDLEEEKWYEYRINKNQNDIYSFIQFVETKRDYYWVGYNNVSFDSQVIEYIIRNSEDWHEKTKLEICAIIAEIGDDSIQRSNYRMKMRYFENTLSFFQIDLMRVHHFDNENKRTSLKWLEFMMEMDSVETTPINHLKKDLTDEEIEVVTKYCYNDVNALRKLWLYTIGEVDNEEYKGKNKIQDRLDIIREFGFPPQAISWSDVKIGDEINLIGYMKRTGKTRKDIYTAKKARKTKKITFGQCIPEYVEFTTPEFNEFYESMKGERVRFFEKQEFPFTYGKTRYLIAKGGIHSVDKRRKIIPLSTDILKDADVGSQYPNAIYKRSLYPSHLGIEWLTNYKTSIVSKDKYKKLGKQGDKRAKGIEGMYKLALNGGGFGKTNEMNSWQYGPEVTFACTIGNQFEILMLIEKMETTGIRVISANTDGIVCIYPAYKQEQYERNCTWWEQKVGNLEMGKLEYTEFSKIFQTSVNDYIAIKKDKTVKKKGDFLTDHELNKNKNRKIVPIALEKYVVEGIPVEKTILKHQNIHDFLIGVKAGQDYHYEFVDRKTNEREEFKRLVVYYVSRNGRTLLKIKNEDSDAKGNDVTQCEAIDKDDEKHWLCTVANQLDKHLPIEEYDIDYEYYIRKTRKIIASVEGKLPPPEQTSLF